MSERLGDGADRVGRQLAVGRGCDEQLRAVGEEFGRAALVGLDMGGGRADHAVIGLAERRQRQRIGRGAVEGEEHLAIGGEQGAEGVRGALGPVIVAISGSMAAIGLFHRFPGFGADPGIIVAGELLHFGHHAYEPSHWLPHQETNRRVASSRWLPDRPHPSAGSGDTTLPGGQVGAGRRPDS